MEEPKRLPILRDVRELLLRNSGCRCAFPNCNKPIFDDNDRLKGELCHIEAAMPLGERFNPLMSNEERRSYNNLILLCFDHHEETNDEDVYTVGVLQEMKKAHERNVSTVLSLMGLLSERSYTGNSTQSEINPDRVRRAMELFNIQEQFNDIERKGYPQPLDYIKRSVYYLNEASGWYWAKTKLSLIELVKTKKHITLLGVAGSGKSIELEYLAYHFSFIDKEFFPIKIRLNSFNRTDGIEDLLGLEFREYVTYKDQKLLIILDALDEVAPENLHEAVRQIETLKHKLPYSTIVVSCRNNFYSVETANHSSRITGFDTYGFFPLTTNDIDDYCENKLKESKSTFFEDLNSKKFNDQLNSPFYLVNLVSYFKENNKLPNSRSEVFEFLIKQRIEIDKNEKYKNHGLSLEQNQKPIEATIQRLAIAAEYMQRNYLEDEEFRLLVPDINLQTLIEHTFLFDKNKNGSWEFQHNNFQEYLAAKYLSKTSYHRIKQFIAFNPEFKKVKPTWVNTISFLFGLIEKQNSKFQKLLKWLISSEIELAIRFEKDNIDLKTRELIFIKIYSAYEQKKILIRSEKFNLYEMGEFVSDSHFVAKFLIDKARKLDEPRKKVEALRILANLESSKQYLAQIEALVLSLICMKSIQDEFKYSFLYTLRDLNIYSDELTRKLLKIIELDSSQYIRAGLYAYLCNATSSDIFIDIIIRGISFIKEPKVYKNASEDDPKEIRLSDEKYYLERLIEKFQSVELTHKLLDWGLNIDERRYDRFHIDTLNSVLMNATALTENNPELYDKVLLLLVSFARRYSRDLSEKFNNYFSITGTSLRAFNELRRQSKDLKFKTDIDYHMAIAAVLDKSCVDQLLEEFRAVELSKNQVDQYMNLLIQNNSELHKYFYSEINKLSNDSFVQVPINFALLKIEKLQNDVKLLLDKEAFQSELDSIFEKAGVDILTWDDLFEYRREYLNDNLTKNNIVLESLRKEARVFGDVKRSAPIKNLNSEDDWYWFQINHLIEIDIINADLEFDETTKVWLRNWVIEALQKADFKSAIYLNEHGEIIYRYLEHYIPYISHRIDFELDEEIYLDFLWLIPNEIPQKSKSRSKEISELENTIEILDIIPSNICDYVVEKTDFERASRRIIDNINSGRLIDFDQKYNHCQFCAKHGIIQGVGLIKDLLLEKEHRFEKVNLIEWYLTLSNDLSLIEISIDTYDEETRFRALELLLDANSTFADEYCIRKAKAINETDKKFRYISILAKANKQSAFELYKNWIISNQKIPNNYFVRDIPKSESINDYFELFEDAIVNDYGKGNMNHRNQFIDVLIDLGSKNESNFRSVRRKFEFWIKKYDLKFLFYRMQSLELEYYTGISQKVSISEVIEIINRKDDDVISCLNGFIELKPNIAGFGFNFNRLIEYYNSKKQ